MSCERAGTCQAGDVRPLHYDALEKDGPFTPFMRSLVISLDTSIESHGISIPTILFITSTAAP